jgi:hypothetical protein
VQPRRQDDSLPQGWSAKAHLLAGHMARDNVAKARQHPPDTMPLVNVCRLPPCWRFCRYQQVGAGSEPAWDVVAELEADGDAKHALMAPEIWG